MCKQQPFCDVIPLEVVLPPTLKPADEFPVSVKLGVGRPSESRVFRPAATSTPEPTDVNDLTNLFVLLGRLPIGEELARRSATSAN